MPMNNRLLRPTTGLDPDAAKYLAAVEAADGEPLEPAVRTAINAFFRAIKAVGLLDAIGGCCILAGARTITGALIPVAGVAPTANGGWASGDYSRTGGLTGDDIGLYLDSNYVLVQDDHHAAAYFKINSAGFDRVFGASQFGNYACYFAETTAPGLRVRDFSNTDNIVYAGLYEGFGGLSRQSSGSFFSRADNTTLSHSDTSSPNGSNNLQIFGENRGNVRNFTDASISFYCLGDAITEPQMEALDTAVTNLITAIGNAL